MRISRMFKSTSREVNSKQNNFQRGTPLPVFASFIDPGKFQKTSYKYVLIFRTHVVCAICAIYENNFSSTQ